MNTVDNAPDGGARLLRLLNIVREIRGNRRQTPGGLMDMFGISRSQFYKDKQTLREMGFDFKCLRNGRTAITEDRISPLTELTSLDRLILMYALEELGRGGDGPLAALAVQIGLKLAGGLESPFKEQLESCFERTTQAAFGVEADVVGRLQNAVADPGVIGRLQASEPGALRELRRAGMPEDALDKLQQAAADPDHAAMLQGAVKYHDLVLRLQKAIREGRCLEILYTRSEDWTQHWRRIVPRKIYSYDSTLYVYAWSLQGTPSWKVFKVNRIEDARETDECFSWEPGNDCGFERKRINSFSGLISEEEPETLRVRFSGPAMHYVMERRWHPSQKITRSRDSIVVSLTVSDPGSVRKWAAEWGGEVLPD